MPGKKTANQRLSREEWLERALEAIASEPHGKLRIHELVKSLGVTRGSFYWHFKDREDFVRSIAEFYDRWSTDQVIEAVRSESHPKDRLRALMNFVFEHHLGRFEMAIHAWAFQEPTVAAAVALTENNRLVFIRSIFSELGFDGAELETRVRAFVGYMNLDHSSFAREGDEKRLKRLEERLDFFTRP